MTILEEMAAYKRGREVPALLAQVSMAGMQAAADSASPPLDFADRLKSAPGVALIAEVKKASPSAGVIRADFDPAEIAATYEAHGATCLSVLTDEPYFQGRLEYLETVRHRAALPVLRKDFIVDPYQLLQARAIGADAVLLIAECLDDAELGSLVQATLALGMTPLVELHEPANLPRVMGTGAHLIGVNNRNLRTFEVDLNHTLRMREQVPDDCVLVGESGIRSRADVKILEAAGVDAILVGESLLREADIGAAVDRLLG